MTLNSVRRYKRHVKQEMSAEPSRRRAYTPDIGWRVVWNRIGLDMTFGDIGRRLQIAPSTAHRLYKRFLRTDDVVPQQPGSRAQSRVLDENHEMILIAMVMENLCMYLREMCLEIRSATAIDVSGSTICRTLKRHGFTRKRIKLVAKQRSLIYRSYFMAQVLGLNTAHFV